MNDPFSSGTQSGAPSVLVVERNQSVRDLVQRALEPQYRVQTVVTYDQVRRRVQDERYDGILLSVYRRDVEEGIALMTTIRSTSAHAEVPIILVCRPPISRGEEALFDAGFDDVLRMPFAQSDLLEVLSRHLGDG